MLRRAIRVAGSVTETAKRLRRSRDWLNRLLRGNVALGPEICIRLAIEFDEDPIAILKAADKAELADLLQRAGFRQGEVPLSDRGLLADLKSLSPHQQDAIRVLIRSMLTKR